MRGFDQPRSIDLRLRRAFVYEGRRYILGIASGGSMLRLRRSITLAVLLAAITLSIGCGISESSSSSASSNAVPGYGEGIGASGQTGAAKFLYANPLPDGGPYALAIGPNGTLTAETGGSADNIDTMNMAIDPSGSFLFQTAQGYDGGTQGGLFAYVIDRSNGSLTTASGSPYMTTQSLFSDVVDNTGKFLYVQGESAVYGFSIQTGGALTPISGSPFAVAGSPSSPGFSAPAHLMVIDQLNRYLYVSTSAGISAYTINSSTGQLAAISGSPFGSDVSNPWAITVTPNNSFLYELQSTNSGVMYGYSIDSSSGALTAVSGSPFNVGNCGSSMPGIPGPDNITIPSAGNFMYTNCGIYSLDSGTGGVTQVSNFVSGDWPVIDPTGNFLWAITVQQNCFQCNIGVTTYQVDPSSGNLTVVPNSFFQLTNSEVGSVASLAITQ
jgi:6-phosphogluconolactonase (cycloisomerase 2 family)